MTDVVRAYRQHYEAQSMSIDNSIARGSTQQASVAHVMLSQYWLELQRQRQRQADRPITSQR
jgi:hypothetical protein